MEERIDPEDPALWRALAQHASEFLCIVDDQLRFRWVNRVRPDLTMEAVLGQSLATFITDDSFERAKCSAEQVLRTGQPATFLSKNLVKGQRRWSEGTLGLLPGHKKLMFLAARNITEQRRAEDDLRDAERSVYALIEAFPDGLVLTDGDGIIVAMSDAAAGILNVVRTALVGHSVFEFTGPDGFAIRRQWFDRVLASRDTVHEIDDTSVRAYDTRAMPIFDADNEVKNIAFVIRDITAQRAAERLLEAQRERRWHSEKMAALGTLASGIAHDFNNLLTPIFLNAHIASRESTHAAIRARLLKEIIDTASRAASIIKQILSYGRIDDAARELTDLASAVRECVRLVTATLPANIATTIDVPDCGVWIDACPARIQQALINLCINAGRAMADEGGALHLELSVVRADEGAPERPPELPDGDYAVVRIADTGTGIPQTELPRIFDPFYSTRPPDQGAGLGLFVVQGVVSEHEGAITVESEVGEGTQFEVWLPLVDDNAPSQTTSEAPAAIPRSLTLLVVDDDVGVLTATAASLRADGHKVHAHTTAAAALADLGRNPGVMAAAILDQMLMDGTGLELAASVRSMEPDLPVLLCSGHLTSDVNAAAQRAGIATIAKPYAPAQLQAWLSGVQDRGSDG